MKYTVFSKNIQDAEKSNRKVIHGVSEKRNPLSFEIFQEIIRIESI